MFNLNYQNTNNKCRGWANPNTLLFGPKIDNLSSYQSPAGSNTMVTIYGTNFYSYSRVVFGTYNPTVYFINSNILEFYIPNILGPQTVQVQVFNGSVGSNTVSYTIDMSSAFWLLNQYGAITNTNTDGTYNSMVQIQSLSRGTPITVTSVNPSYTVGKNVNWIICNNDSSTSGLQFNIILPYGTGFAGRELTIKLIGLPATIVATTQTSQLITIYSLDGTPNGNVIFDGNAGNWVTLVYDGMSSWYIMQGN